MDNWTEREWNIFYSIYEKLPRVGPGDNDSTGKAYGFFKDLPETPRIIDIGCGPGMQTIELGKLSKGEVWAIDSHEPFLNELKNNVVNEGLGSFIRTVNMDMCKLDVPENYFDVIWAEGAIYFYGYENALKDWKKYFRDKIRFAFTEPNWFRDDIPEDVLRVWKEYPKISSIHETIGRIEKQGYKILGYFKLPEDSWKLNYFGPLKAATEQYIKENSGIEIGNTVIDSILTEINDYEKYSDYYGYTFYICEALGI